MAAVTGIAPIIEVDGRPIGTGFSGLVAAQLAEAFEQKAREIDDRQ